MTAQQDELDSQGLRDGGEWHQRISMPQRRAARSDDFGVASHWGAFLVMEMGEAGANVSGGLGA